MGEFNILVATVQVSDELFHLILSAHKDAKAVIDVAFPNEGLMRVGINKILLKVVHESDCKRGGCFGPHAGSRDL